MPELSKNLSSVSVVTRNGGGEFFLQEQSTDNKKNRKKILVGSKDENGLYTMELAEEKIGGMLAEKSQAKLARRHGQLSVKNVKKLSDIVSGINLTELENDAEICEICLQAKQTRLPFLITRRRATRSWNSSYGCIWPDRSNYEYSKEYVQEAEALHNLKVTKIR